MTRAGAIFAALCAMLTVSGAVAQTAAPLAPSPRIHAPRPAAQVPTQQGSAATTPQLTPQDVSAWLDGYMPYAIGKANIPGAVVVVVSNGQIVASRGYGYANVEKRTKVDPQRTLFRPGSISKLFVWTSVMQQVEQGKLDLNADVNRYLDFKIPAFEGKPITLANIMTHTAGFEESAKGIITTDAKTVKPFDVLLKSHVPARVYAPGTTPAYSNYATSLAAYIVQRVSGEPFYDYLDRHVFAPLGMNQSTFRQPLPANLKPFMAEGYMSGRDKPYGFEYIGPAPAGSLSATGENMGRFMIAHLNNGAGILKPETARLMHSRLNLPIPGLNGMAHGFYENNINGTRVIAHGGDTVAFHSDLHLFLDKGAGLYVSFNSAGNEGAAGDLRTALFEDFADRYFPAPADIRKIDAKAAKANAEKLAGQWTSSRRNHSSFLAITDLIGQNKIGVGKDGELLAPFAKGLNGQDRKWVAVGPMLWRDANGHELLGAKMENGKAVQMSLNGFAPIIVMQPVPASRSASWLLPLLYVSLGVLLLTALLWPTRALVRRRFGAALALEGRRLQAFRASRGAALAILLVLGGWLWAISAMFSDLTNLGGAFDTILLLLQFLSAIVFIGGAAVMAWYAYTMWTGSARWTAKLWSVLLVIAALTVLYIGIVYHLIGWTTNY